MMMMMINRPSFLLHIGRGKLWVKCLLTVIFFQALKSEPI